MTRPLIAGLLTMLLTAGCLQTEDTHETNPTGRTIHGIRFSPEQLKEIRSLSPLPPLPRVPQNQYADNEQAAVLGRRLFFETRLSSNNEVSCATCHDPKQDFTDGKPLSEGLETVTRNSPTLFNQAYNRWFFWDGRKDSLWAQSLGPIENAKEMGGSRVQTYHLIANDPLLRQEYEAVFGKLTPLETSAPPKTGYPVPGTPEDEQHLEWSRLSEADQKNINRTFANSGKSIAAYERQLISSNAPFDQFVAALDSKASSAEAMLPASAVRGLKIFIEKGQCTFCHSGPNFTDLEFHNIGLDRGENGLDTGRFEAIKKVKRDPFNGLGSYSDERSIEQNKSLFYLAQKPNNLGEFKTPTLRNVANTAPYMHDGRFASLREVIRFYSLLNQTPALGHREETLQPLDLSESEIEDLAAFLSSLTGAPLQMSLLEAPTDH